MPQGDRAHHQHTYCISDGTVVSEGEVSSADGSLSFCKNVGRRTTDMEIPHLLPPGAGRELTRTEQLSTPCQQPAARRLSSEGTGHTSDQTTHLPAPVSPHVPCAVTCVRNASAQRLPHSVTLWAQRTNRSTESLLFCQVLRLCGFQPSPTPSQISGHKRIEKNASGLCARDPEMRADHLWCIVCRKSPG